MRHQSTTPNFQTEGFQAHQYLSQRLRRKRQRAWKYHTSSQLTTALAQKSAQWKKAKVREVSVQEQFRTATPKQLTFEFELTALFQSLVKWWQEDTKHVSNMNKAIAHPAYQQIIGIGKVLGSQVVPLLLKELAQRPDHWFHALIEITGTDAGTKDETFDGAVSSWLDWGKRKGYLVDARSPA